MPILDTSTTASHQTSAESNAVDRFLDAIRTASMPTADTLYLDTVHLDATVPGWRFRVNGVIDVLGEYSRWFPAAATLTELTRHATATGEVVEYVVEFNDDGETFRLHHVHVLTIDRDRDRISEDHVWCGGRWSTALVANMEAAN